MADKLLICVTAQQVTLAHWRGQKIGPCRVFDNDQQGLSGFEDFLAQFSNLPVYIVVDTVEEDYRFEMLPHAFGSDRSEMVGRKLRQYYRNTPYYTASLQGRESTKRRDDRYLFSALTNPDLVNAWVQPVLARGLPIAGIYLLPIVSAALFDKLDIKPADLLVVAQHSGGLRITFFRDGRSLLSRLTRGEASRGENRAAFISTEISNTLLYLHALRTTILDEQLTVLLLDRDDKLVDIADRVAHDNPSFKCVRVGAGELASRLGVDLAHLAVSPEVMYLQFLGLQAPASNLIPPQIAAGYRRYQKRRAIYAVAAAVVAVATAWSLHNLYQAIDANAQGVDAARQTAVLQVRYREVTQQFPAAPTSAENLQKAVAIAQSLMKTVRTPELMMSVISKALEKNPTITLKEFDWKFGPAEIESSALSPPAASSASPPATGKALLRYQSGLIQGEIHPFRGDYRAAINTITHFTDRLKADRAVEKVRIVKLPLNISPTLSLSGNTLDSQGPPGTAEFKVVVVLKRTP